MEFSGQYLKYEEYRTLGGTLNLASFNLLEFKARKLIDENTLNRLKDLATQKQEVKLCIYELINEMERYGDKKNISSESVGSYSVSYINNNNEENKNLNNIIFDYLIDCKTAEGIPYLYRGVC